MQAAVTLFISGAALGITPIGLSSRVFGNRRVEPCIIMCKRQSFVSPHSPKLGFAKRYAMKNRSRRAEPAARVLVLHTQDQFTAPRCADLASPGPFHGADQRYVISRISGNRPGTDCRRRSRHWARLGFQASLKAPYQGLGDSTHRLR